MKFSFGLTAGLPFQFLWQRKTPNGDHSELRDEDQTEPGSSLAMQLRRLNALSSIDPDSIESPISRRRLSVSSWNCTPRTMVMRLRNAKHERTRPISKCRIKKEKDLFGQLPPELRTMIWELALGDEWHGTIPNLIKALRPYKKKDGGMYHEALDVFYREKTYVLHEENDWNFGDMEWGLIKTIERVVIVPSDNIFDTEKKAWFPLVSIGGFHLIQFNRIHNIQDVTMDFSSLPVGHWLSLGVFCIDNREDYHERCQSSFSGFMGTFENLRSFTLILPQFPMFPELRRWNFQRRLEDRTGEAILEADKFFGYIGGVRMRSGFLNGVKFAPESLEEGDPTERTWVWNFYPSFAATRGSLFEFLVRGCINQHIPALAHHHNHKLSKEHRESMLMNEDV